MANQYMHRREALQKLAILLGGTLSLPVQAALLGEKRNFTPIDIPSDQQALITQLAEVIMPETDTPGAKKAGVGEFIVRVIKDCSSAEEQQKFMQGLQKTDTLSQSSFGKPFTGLNLLQQTEVMNTIARQEKDFFLNLRELTIVGFFTSQTGATEVLQYLPVPGRFQGDIPLQSAHRSWAT
jgi:hypothetical protein